MIRTRILLVMVTLFIGAAAGDRAQAGTSPLAGRTVSNVSYRLSPSGKVASLRFTLTAPTLRVRVRVSPTAPWRRCRITSKQVTCPLGVPPAALNQLELAAY